ncbi:hypothetical protein SADUNF_Sadunf14G0051700 [Salix dunnii]|uniref:protein-ribulosamine 3-kinase n=1 Tax=Salix dunnii TaxID=1413687 RepID=A0A835MPS1_9ROSI|nr:hypothetical protein SADUNF_Sadunf14G0051700 [Salix dunnii]
MVTSHIGLSSLNSCFPSLPRLSGPCFTKRKPFAALVFVLSSTNLYLILVIAKRVSGFLVISLYCNDLVMGLFDACSSFCEVVKFQFWITRNSAIGGGCINNARHYDTDANSFVAKTNRNGVGVKIFYGSNAGLGVSNLPCLRERLLAWVLCMKPEQSRLDPYQQVDHTSLWSLLNLGCVEVIRIWQAPLFENIDKEPFLLHGDSWSGNISSDKNGKPVTLDPACYRGHNEAEFGTSWCASFGGSFYNACFECPVLKCLVMPPTALPCQCQGNSCHSLAQPCNSGSSIWIPKGKVASTTL